MTALSDKNPFLYYILNEVKEEKLNKDQAKLLIKKFQESLPETKVKSIHPLVHKNTSDFSEQRYSSFFYGNEFFLNDHVVLDEKILPAVAYLEMAREAITQAEGPGVQNPGNLKITNVIWSKPIIVKDKIKQVNIGLFQENDESIAFEIYTEGDHTGELHVHCKGSAVWQPEKKSQAIDIDHIKQLCNQKKITARECYSLYERMGIKYGPAHQSVSELFIGDQEVVAKIDLPAGIRSTLSDYTLHPSMLDAALQAIIGITLKNEPLTIDSELPLVLPFAVEKISILGTCTSSMWVRIRKKESQNRLLQFDIQMYSEDGLLIAELQKYTVRSIEKNALQSQENNLLVLAPEWMTVPDQENSQGDIVRKLVILSEENDHQFSKEQFEVVPTIFKFNSFKIASDFENIAMNVFEEVKKTLLEKPKQETLFQVAISSIGEESLLDGIWGILKTASLENPKFKGQLLILNKESEVAEQLRLGRNYPEEQKVKIHNGKVQSLKWNQVPDALLNKENCWKENGVYLITGGAGGLGRLFVEEILRYTKDSKIIITGRSAINSGISQQLVTWNKQAARVSYKEMDVQDLDQVKSTINEILETAGAMNGIIHAAGIIADNFIIKKTTEEFRNVLAPKVKGIVHLDEATKALSLDFLVGFSSVASGIGNPGQADYATANAFLDAFSRYRNLKVSTGERKGKTISINWPLWKNGGMQLNEQLKQSLIYDAGLAELSNELGFQAFYCAVNGPHEQIMPLEGVMPVMKSNFIGFNQQHSIVQEEIETEKYIPVASENRNDLEFKASEFFKQLLSSVIKLAPKQIDIEAPLEKYGIDSIMIMNLTTALEKSFGSLSKTLFFEYQSIQELTQYFISEHKTKLLSLIGTGEQVKPVTTDKITPLQSIPKHTPEPSLKERRNFRTNASAEKVKATPLPDEADIAIIGMAGKYPQAKDIREFWKNIKNGVDSVTEIPGTRWDHSLYFDENKDTLGKTYGKWGGFIDGVDEFDPMFFNISPREAEILDPQERLFLQCVYSTFEDAGYTPKMLGQYNSNGMSGNIGVYVGVMYEEYQLYGVQDQIGGRSVYPSSGVRASIANRISYYFNLHGPSMAVDTMCSSSLTAIHLACESLKRGETQLAIAGGVNVSIHPHKYLYLAQGRFLSAFGRCESFGKGGDGYVPGEGVGAVLLKPLALAVENGDHIYGIIKGTAINHGGKTNGYTVPNPNAHANIIENALKKAGVNPRSISYIEAHGTGTSLGDPIEIAGLNKAFGKFTQDTQFCSIGSSKSNIGHLESAAGIGGVTKLLLQMKHKQLAPSLHAEVLNPNIDFKSSPFIVQQNLAEWKCPVLKINGEETMFPRIAGVSSFGAGGSNAHIVIQEYQSTVPAPHTTHKEVALLFSAQSEDQLMQLLTEFATAIQNKEFEETDLERMAYTLQTGRENHPYRLALLTSSIALLEQQLQQVISGKQHVENVYTGWVNPEDAGSIDFFNDEDLKNTIALWLEKGKFIKLIEVWIKGVDINWKQHYTHVVSKISLPTYPFAKEKYWVPEAASSSKHAGKLHPLLHRNVSNLSGIIYSSDFTGNEFFLADHKVNNDAILPGVAYLELAREAVALAIGNKEGALHLKNILWSQPFIFEKNTQKNLQVKIDINDLGEIEFNCYSVQAGNEMTHASGKIQLVEMSSLPKFNLNESKQICDESIPIHEFYEFFNKTGIQYGAAHKGIVELNAGAEMVLARITLPENLQAAENDYYLHPAIMDAAVQATLAMRWGQDVSNPPLPFSLDSVHLFGPTQPDMWAIVTPVSLSNQLNKYDIRLVDDQHHVCVLLKGFATRDLPVRQLENKPAATPGFTSTGVIHATPIWSPVQPGYQQGLLNTGLNTYIIGGTVAEQKALQEQLPHAQLIRLQEDTSIEKMKVQFNDLKADHFIWLCSNDETTEWQSFIKLQNKGAALCQLFLKALIECGYDAREITLTVVTNQSVAISESDAINPGHSSMHGLMGALAKEYSNWKIRFFDIEENSSAPVTDLLQLKELPAGDVMAYRNGEWYEQKLVPFLPFQDDNSVYRENGNYVVIGGAGGIGYAWSKYVIEKYDAQVIWIGRRPKDESIQHKIDILSKSGKTPEYFSVDAKELSAMSAVYARIKERYASIHGVINSAIVLSDGVIANMNKEKFRAGLSAKVDVSVQMAEVFADENLDFMLFFSSLNSFLKPAGQSNYSSGCTFKDAFASLLRKQLKCKVKVMNWGYWGNTGIVASEVYKNAMSRAGIDSIEAPEAMKALEMLLQGPLNQVSLIKTLRPVYMREMNTTVQLEIYPRELGSFTGKFPVNLISENDLAFNENYFKQGISKAAVTGKNNYGDALLSELGLDEITIAEICRELGKAGASVTPLQFYQFRTVNELSEFYHQEKKKNRIEMDSSVAQLTNEQQDFKSGLNIHLNRLLFIQLKEAGLFEKTQHIEELFNASGILQKHMRWLTESLTVLDKAGYVKFDGQFIQPVLPPPDIKEGWNNWEKQKEQWLKDPDKTAEVTLVDQCIRSIPDIIKGKKAATDVLFPNSSMELVEGIYKDHPVTDYFNNVIADTVVTYLLEKKKENVHSKINILEIGAGTGGTSFKVFEKLKPYQEHVANYCYTDLSRAFLIHAENKYGKENPFLTYQIFNASKPLEGQGIPKNHFDIVIATNVLHATPNIRTTLRNSKTVLKKNGLFLVNELVSNTLFNHLTFGLLDGWWLYEDKALRIPGCPALTPENWKNALTQEGFEDICFPAEHALALEQQVIAAVSDGIVMQPVVQKEGTIEKSMEKKQIATSLIAVPKKDSGRSVVTQPKTGVQLKEKLMDFLKGLISDTLKIPLHKIQVTEPMENYGIDSILVIQLTNAVRTLIEDVSSTIFFEFQTLQALCNHLLENHKDVLRNHFDTGSIPETEKEGPVYQEALKIIPIEVKKSKTFSAIAPGEPKQTKKQKIAIVGMAGRYPGAENIERFWNNLKEGKESIGEIPEDRWNWKDYFDEEKGNVGKMYSRHGGFIEDIACFDPLYFQISPREAARMDPQERLFIQTVHAAIEDAGYIPEALSVTKNVGVYVGVMNGTYPTGTSYWSVANRVSYLMDFHGPSMAVDTACSSSLSAIHLAVESICNGTIDCAIAGGVNLIIAPLHYQRLSEMVMLSPGKKLAAFGNEADGFVDGEGVGAIVLKSVEKAQEDGDHIYGLIIGSSLNAGGKTNGYTVPNPAAQSELIVNTIEKAGVHPDTITCIEAHGTGTLLGDPIEITGLQNAFRKYTERVKYCAIGSVKTNIGHLESAAGIAGLTKILLQMKHKQLVPSLHSKTLNPNINFEKSPFIVQQQLQKWDKVKVEINGVMEEHPRRAALSSFGAGGANAHMLLEEFETIEEYTGTGEEQLILLSAQSPEQLKQQAALLLEWSKNNPEKSIEHIAFTLQLGRKAHRYRLAFMARSVEGITSMLKEYLTENEIVKDVFTGQINPEHDIEMFEQEEELQVIIKKWVTQNKLNKLAELWVKGFKINWNELHSSGSLKRLSLPTYPFRKDPYWSDGYEDTKPVSPAKIKSAKPIQSVLHQNISDFNQQKYLTVFDGTEFYLDDHRVNDSKVLPGVVYLEMTYQGYLQALGTSDEKPVIELSNVTWQQPFIHKTNATELKLRFLKDESPDTPFELFSLVDHTEMIHCQGFIGLSKKSTGKINVTELKSKCTHVVSAKELYEKYERAGITYGNAHQSIVQVRIGEDLLIAELQLPDEVKNTIDQYTMHPSITDGALQAIRAFDMTAEEAELPFEVKEMHILGPCTARMDVIVQLRSLDSHNATNAAYDVMLCDKQGNVVIQMEGFSTRKLKQLQHTDTTEKGNAVMFMPVWDSIEFEAGINLVEPEEKIMVIGATPEQFNEFKSVYTNVRKIDIPSAYSIEMIKEKISSYEVDHIFWIAEQIPVKNISDETLISEQNNGVVKCLKTIKALLQLGYADNELTITFVTTNAQQVYKNDPVNPLHAALSGFVGSLAKEYPHWKIRMADVETNTSLALKEIIALPVDANGEASALRMGEWLRQKLIPTHQLETSISQYKKNGVYVVIGGAGGVGMSWTEYMIKNYQAQIIWMGRRTEDQTIRKKIKKCALLGPAPVYFKADATDKEELRKAFNQLKQQFPVINGLIHSAITLLDRSIANMEVERFVQALGSKVTVSVRMAQLFAEEQLDFVMFFSSLNAFTKNPGQSNYAAGCTFNDAFAMQMGQEWNCKVKVMNWGYWGNVGVVATDEYRSRMKKIGLSSIEPEEAMDALETLIRGPVDQLVFYNSASAHVANEIPNYNNLN